MPRRVLYLLITAFAAIAMTYWWYTPQQIAKRQVRALFEEFTQTVNTNDRAKIGAFLKQYLADDALIQLDIGMSVLGVAAGDGVISSQRFTKETFIPFIDNTLYTLETYDFEIYLRRLLLDKDGRAQIEAKVWADAHGLNHLMGKRIATRWVLKSECEGGAFIAQSPRLHTMYCIINLNQEPDLQGKSLNEVVEEYQKTLQEQ